MADLIDPESRQWDSKLLQGLFNPSEAGLIKSSPTNQMVATTTKLFKGQL